MKIQITEYSSGILIKDIPLNGMSITDFLNSVEKANNKISTALKTGRKPLTISNGRLSAQGITGAIKLAHDLELDVIPKFYSSNDAEWKKSIYLLSVLSKHGKILSQEKIKSNISSKNALYDIAGRVLADEYLLFKRKLVRKYRKENFNSFSIEGELDFDSIFEKNPNGTKQSSIHFDKQNIYNSTIKNAMQIVLPYVSDIRTRNILSSAIINFGKQEKFSLLHPRIPSRNKEWENSYNLSYDIIQGSALAFNSGNFVVPGFVANTWQIWEWLITTAISIGSLNKKVFGQYSVKWGEKECGRKNYSVNVFPDVTIFNKDDLDKPLYLVDAKYKLLENDDTGEIARADLYEAFAFCDSLNTKDIFLAYPMQESESYRSGSIIKKSSYKIKDITVHAVKINVGSIIENGGLISFSKEIVKGLEDILFPKSL